jgi:hypothetical protein
MTHQSEDNFDGTFVLTGDVLAPTPTEIAVVEAEVGDEALTRAVERVQLTVQSSVRQRVDAPKVRDNKA